MPPIRPSLEIEAVEVVFIGSFNPAILHPEWFHRHGLIGEGTDKVKVVSPQGSDLNLGNIHLFSLPDRLIFDIANASYIEKLIDLALAITKLLPHTPVTAIGINHTVHYKLNDENYWHKIGHDLAPKESVWNELFDQPGMLSLSIRSFRKDDFPGTYNITVEPSATVTHGLYVRTNAHFDIPSENRNKGSMDIAGRYIAYEWKDACVKAKVVAEKIFERIKPDAI